MPEVDASHSPVVTRKVGDIVYTFAKFTPRDRANILKQIRAEHRAELESRLSRKGASADEEFAELEAFDLSPKYGHGAFVGHINTPEGQADVHEAAYRKAGGNPDDLRILILSESESLSLAAEICSVGLVPVEPETKKEDSENPTEPGKLKGYGT